MNKNNKDSGNLIRAAAAEIGAFSMSDISELTGIKRSTVQRRMKDITTFTVGELATLMHELPSLTDEKIGKMIREAYR
jgi:hypothetical protein